MESIMTPACTRRALVGGLAGATIAAATLSSSKPGLASTPQTWDMEADIVVCGLGIAGIGAAVEAADAGASVIVLEKEPPETAGGDSMCNDGGIFWSNTDPDMLALMSMGEWSKERCQAMKEEASGITEFLNRGDVVWRNVGDPIDYVEGGGPAFYEAARRVAEASGAQILYSTPAKRLAVDPETGEISGVYANQNGTEIAVRAAKGVVLATGSYCANEDLVKMLNMGGDMDYYSIGSPYIQGDGLKMACSVGGSLANLWRGLEPDYPVCKQASEELGMAICLARPEHYIQPSYITVNAHGKRYWCEDTFMTHWKGNTYGQVSYANYAYDNKPSFLVFDQACFDAQSVGNTSWSYGYAVLSPTEAYLWSEDNSAELERGWIKKADTLEGLAELAGIDPEGLASEVERFNGFAQAGQDDDFGRASMAPLGEGPYYAIEQGVSIIYSISGVRADERARVLDWDGNPIPRLYSAGNIGQGVYLIPIGLQGCWAEGRFAARDAAALEPRA